MNPMEIADRMDRLFANPSEERSMEIAPPWPMEMSHEHRQLAELWALRMATDCRYWEQGVPIGTLDRMGRHLGLFRSWNGGSDVEPQVLEKARVRLDELEATPPQRSTRLCRNVRLLGTYLDFSELEEELLLFSVVARIDQLLRAMVEGVGGCDMSRLAGVLGAVMRRSPDEVCAVLSGRGRLLACGLVFYQQGIDNPLKKLGLRWGLCEALLSAGDSIEELLAKFARPVPGPDLALEDYAHVSAKAELLVNYLKHTIANRRPGRNVLLYGPPGTGKTQLARLVARNAGALLFEGEVEGDEGAPLGVIERLKSLVLVQRLVESVERGAVLIDEIEDVFRPPEGPEPENRGVSAGDSKGWTVRLLEFNPSPTIWISNRVEHIDHAVLRRFDLALEIPAPPLPVREKILARALGRERIESERIGRLLQYAAPAPALLTRAAEVVRSVTPEGTEDLNSWLELVLGGYLAAMGRDPDRDAFAEGLPFDVKWLNSSVDIPRVLDEIRDGSATHILVHGPSGSGKTALAYFIARSLGRPLLHARSRDLIGFMPGETEKRILRHFDCAGQDGSLLLLDHLDWILAAPPDGRPGEAIRAVEQLCAEIDEFDGTVICTTTLSRGFEESLLRRFALRIRLDYLNPSQVRGLACVALTQAGHRYGTDEDGSCRKIDSHFEGLNALTPGDFAGAVSRIRGHSEREALGKLAGMLGEGNELKLCRPRSAIGFTRN